MQDYGISEPVVDTLGDLSRMGKIYETIKFYDKDTTKELNEAKTITKEKGTKDIYDSVIQPLQNIGVGQKDITFQSLTQQSNRGLTWQLSAIDQSMRDIPYFQNGARWKAVLSTRNGIDLNSSTMDGLEINAIQKDIKKYNKSYRNIIFEGEYYGFCAGLIVIKGETNFEEPLDYSKIKEGDFLGIKTLTRLYQIVPEVNELLKYDDIVEGQEWANADMIGMPKYYRVNLESGVPMTSNSNIGFKVHASRILTYRTEHLSYVENKMEMNMGVSMLERVYPDMARYETLLGQAVKMAQRSNVPVLKTTNTSMSTINSDEALLDIFDKLKRMKLAMSNSNMVVIDSEDDFKFENAIFTDVPTMIQELKENLSLSIGAPLSAILKGQTKNADEERAFYFIIDSIQELNMKEWFQRLIPIFYRNRYGKDIEDFDFEFKSLYKPTEKEKAETLKMVGEFATDLYDRNAVDIKTLIKMIQVSQTNVSDITNEFSKEYIEYAESGDIVNSKIKNKINIDIELGKVTNGGGVHAESQFGGDKGGNAQVKKKPTPTIKPEKE